VQRDRHGARGCAEVFGDLVVVEALEIAEREDLRAAPTELRESAPQLLVHLAPELLAVGLRGGAFKPRTSPYAFPGLGEKGLAILAKAREQTGLAVVTEVMSVDQVELVADYADVLAMAAGRDLRGEPYRLIQEALALDPDHVKALALAGTAEFHLGHYDAAIAHWERLMKKLPPDSPLAEGVKGGLATARERSGRPPVAAAPSAPAAQAAPSAPATPAGAEAVQGIVMIDAALAARVKPDDVVFVLARPADGSRMPLAVKRIAVRDLPYAFRLDDSMAMAPGAKLSLHPSVVVTARVSRAGSAAPAKGDLEGASPPIAPGTSGVQITISKVIE